MTVIATRCDGSVTNHRMDDLGYLGYIRNVYSIGDGRTVMIYGVGKVQLLYGDGIVYTMYGAYMDIPKISLSFLKGNY